MVLGLAAVWWMFLGWFWDGLVGFGVVCGWLGRFLGVGGRLAGGLGVCSQAGVGLVEIQERAGCGGQQSWGRLRMLAKASRKRRAQGHRAGSRSRRRPLWLTIRPGMLNSWFRMVRPTVSFPGGLPL